MEESVTAQLPWRFDGTVFRCAWEYPVSQFRAEVEFHTEVLGMTTLADDGEYALLATDGGEITYACRRIEGDGPDLSQHRLTLMTRNIDTVAEALRARTAVETFDGSPVQTVLRVRTPSGLTIDIWEMPQE